MPLEVVFDDYSARKFLRLYTGELLLLLKLNPRQPRGR